ncbi:MAG: hypothetical protein LBL66_03125, partial [Clostridiales bacterium]|nr:hypothetical protein [Clostridiales bacterium]
MKKALFYKIFALAALLAALSACVFLTACKKDPDPTGAPPEKPVVTGVDRHIKLGDSAFDFTAGMPAGVTCDASLVDVGAVGSYTITYKAAGADDVQKTAYVYGLPTLSRNGEAWPDGVVGLPYKQANLAGLSDPRALGITAKDSFNRELTVAVAEQTPYGGEYGDYAVTYSAADAAGNTASAALTYRVEPQSQKTVAPFTRDLADASCDIPIAWTVEEDILSLSIDGVPVDTDLYRDTPAGITLSMDAFNQTGLDTAKTEYNLRLKTDIWYADFTAEVTDAQEPQFVYGYNDWIFEGGDSVRLPRPVKSTAQRYAFEYEAEAGGAAYT